MAGRGRGSIAGFDSDSETEIQEIGMDLEQLGYHEFFQTAFAVFDGSGLIPGRVASATHGIYGIWTGDGPVQAETSGRFEFTAASRLDYPVIGDWVAMQPPLNSGPGIIHHVLERRSCLCRKAPGTVVDVQAMAANVDILMIVMGLDSDFSLRRLERYLAVVEDGGSRPVVVLNKADLCDDPGGRVAAVQDLVGADVPVHGVTALETAAVRLIRHHLAPGVTVAFMGSSGVGKSTLINGLMASDVAATGTVRAFDGRGRHTTTRREMFLLPGGGILIDTPGMRELQPWSESNGVAGVFAEILDLAEHCRFKDCSHRNEPGCAIQAALEQGDLEPDRWKSYLKLQREDAFLEREKNLKARMKETRRWKDITKGMRQRRKIDPKFKE
ncbi:MAG TPA: ribosome small subunit-dependent GTPase A [bacterium]|nr:ribosome small subunit-dependent GTPase A [bacterium]